LPAEQLADPVLETRARALSQELRCLVCQNQSIDDSSADLAHDLHVLVRERLAAGDSDGEVLAFLTDRYGDYVLLRPPVKPTTWALWFGPPVFLLAGLGGVVVRGRRSRSSVAAETAALSGEERHRLVHLMKEGAVQ
jgi:cytochrome c-type biogenesis protein CcmH